ncbi:MAG: hypothetical protein WCH99_09820 [Verrucomicrobiota bacterium]
MARKLFWLALLLPLAVAAQIDPVKRDLVQFGYNQPLEGRAPVAGYAYFYHNQPDFLRTNLTLRVALAPVYLDSELGFVRGLGPNTDFGIGLAGGGFADSYNEIRGGKWIEGESFDGHGAELSASVYHLFNPGDLIPLNFVFRGAAHYSAYDGGDNTAVNFHPPEDGANYIVRTGLRYGGIEPTLFPDLAMELAVWYEGQFRSHPGAYGYSGDREMESASHLFWASAALSYTLPESKQNFFVRLVAGTSAGADRMSAYRLGGFLPLIAEYPLSLPGYYFQELSARQFALVNASYLLPISPGHQWNLIFNSATAGIKYLAGTEQAGNWVSGVGAGILYRSPSNRLKCVLTYAYGIDAFRSDGRGANSISILLQIDLGRHSGDSFNTAQPNHWRGWNWLLGR